MTKPKEKQPDSVTHHEERAAKMRAEAAENAAAAQQAEDEHREKRADKDAVARTEESNRLTKQANLLEEGETRDQLLDRIRKLRDEGSKPVESTAPLGISPYQQSIREIEEEAGRQAVAKAEKMMAEGQKARELVEQERIKREGTMVEVHHPNPGQNEQFPAQKATLGKIKK